MNECEATYREITVLSVNLDERTVDYVMSDDSIDSYDEIVEQKWRLDRFSKNPVVLYAHNHQSGTGFFGGSGLSQDESLPVGRVIKGPSIKGNKKDGYRLLGTVEFAPAEINPFAERVFQMVAGGFLKGGSVGFYPHDVRREVREDRELYVLSDNELFEFSIVPLPANPNAVANALEGREARRAYLERRSKRSQTQQAASGQERSTMDETEMKARLAELEQALETERRNAKTAQDRAQAAEARAAELLAERDAVRADLATVTKERDDALQSAGAVEADLIEAELGALVGKKFHAAELSDMREDRKRLGKEKFAERMARRAPLSTSIAKLGPEPVVETMSLGDHCKS